MGHAVFYYVAGIAPALKRWQSISANRPHGQSGKVPLVFRCHLTRKNDHILVTVSFTIAHLIVEGCSGTNLFSGAHNASRQAGGPPGAFGVFKNRRGETHYACLSRQLEATVYQGVSALEHAPTLTPSRSLRKALAYLTKDTNGFTTKQTMGRRRVRSGQKCVLYMDDCRCQYRGNAFSTFQQGKF